MDTHSNEPSFYSRSVQQDANQKTDDQLLPRQLYLDVKPNNQFVDFDKLKSIDTVVLEVLKGHPLCDALTSHTTVPAVYVQQLWHSIKFVVSEQGSEFTFNLDGELVAVNLTYLRRLLALPTARYYPRVKEFRDPVDEETLCADLIKLGYTKPLGKLTEFRRNNLTGRWLQFFGILMRSLSPQSTGLDKANKNFLQLFHSFCFHRHVDFALLLWNDLRECVNQKATRRPKNYVPYIRFFQIIIKACMAQFPQITKRSLDGAYKPMPIKYFHSVSLAEGETEMTIPLKLVRMADQSHPAVIAYLQEKYPAIFEEPVDVPTAPVIEETMAETEPTNVEEAAATVQEAEIDTEPEIQVETGAESPDVGGEESFHSMPGESGDYDSDDQSPPPPPSPVAKRKKSLARKKDTPEKR